MSLPDYSILIATLLAWYDLDSELSTNEKTKFRNIGLQLQTDLMQWETSEKELLKIIEKNPKLAQLFQYYKSCLAQNQTNSLLSLMPQETALALVAPLLPVNNNKGVIPNDSNSEEKSNEITNIFIRIAMTLDPSVSIKKVKNIEKIKQSVQSVIPKI